MVTFHPNLDDDYVKEHLHLFSLDSKIRLCGFQLFKYYECANCPFGISMSSCTLSYSQNPHLHLLVAQIRLAHPELLI